MGGRGTVSYGRAGLGLGLGTQDEVSYGRAGLGHSLEISAGKEWC